MPKEESVGAVIYNKGKYLILHYKAGHWGFPKGHIEEGETHLQAIRREVEEETGLTDVYYVKGFEKKIHYFFKKDGETVYKEVTFYIFENKEIEVRLSNEHVDYAWVRFHEAISKLTFQNAKEVLREADHFINKSIRT